MASRQSRADHDAAVSRRLEQLTAELAGVRGAASHGGPERWPADDLPESAEPAGVPEPDVPRLPEPGRHAARRRTKRGEAMVPAPLRGRVALGPAQVAVVAVLVALGLAVTAWTVVRGRPAAVDPVAPSGPTSVEPAEPLAAPSGPTTGSEPTGGAAAPPTAAGESVTVDVAGKVRRPGIAVLEPGSRVVDALEAAGGVRPGVDLSGLNLARPLVDGEQVLVGVTTPAGVPAGPAAAPPASSAAPGGGLVNINTADLTLLETLPEVGPVTAQSIVTWREQNGGFTAVDELLEVDGIGEATLASMAPFVTV